jgi:photosystem II stability/assembly factor-like uncharacterized protein
MSCEHRRSRPSLARWGWSFALGLLCLALAACGGAAAQQSPRSTPASTPAARTGYAPTVNATPYAPTPPYTFAGTWTTAPGLSSVGGAGSFTFAPSDGHIGYLCSAATGHLYTTRDGGASWSQLHVSATTGCSDVFVDGRDASDLFMTSATVAQTNGFPTGYDLWRSRDAGASWSKLSGVQKPTDPRLAWSQLVVYGSQLIGAVQVDQEGYLQNGLFTSSDDGATWKSFAQSVANQGYMIGGFTVLGSAIYIDTTQGTNPGGQEPQLWPDHGGAQSTTRSLEAPHSGQPTSGPIYWRSLDGGATWRQVTLPGTGALPMRLYATGRYALVVSSTNVSTDNQNPLYDAQMWWSADSGATWKRLPDMRGLENGYVIAGGRGNGTLALAPDGSVIAAAQHAAQSYGDDAGVFRIQPGAASPAWTPLVAGGVQFWQTSQTSAGVHLWGTGAFGNAPPLEYVDVV